MAEKSEKVMEMVRDQLKKNPDVETDALFEKARKIESSIGDLSLRQFHARYPLQVKRKMASGRRKKKKKKKKSATGRSRGRRATAASGTTDGQRAAIREGLLSFAKDVAAADAKADLINVLTSVDEYVDSVVKSLD